MKEGRISLNKIRQETTEARSMFCPSQSLWLSVLTQWMYDANLDIDLMDLGRPCKSPEHRTWYTLEDKKYYTDIVSEARDWLTDPRQWHYDIIRMAGLDPNTFLTRARQLLAEKQEQEDGVLRHPSNGEVLLRYS